MDDSEKSSNLMHDTITAIPLLEITADTRALLIQCLPEESIQQWLHVEGRETIGHREEGDREGKSLHMVFFVNEVPMGWAGWLQYVPHPSWVQTTTYLTPSMWGTGLNACAKGLLYKVAVAANIHLIASTQDENMRSRRALEKLWPTQTPWHVWEENRRRWANVFSLSVPPKPYVTWDDAVVESIVQRVRSIPLPQIQP